MKLLCSHVTNQSSQMKGSGGQRLSSNFMDSEKVKNTTLNLLGFYTIDYRIH